MDSYNLDLSPSYIFSMQGPDRELKPSDWQWDVTASEEVSGWRQRGLVTIQGYHNLPSAPLQKGQAPKKPGDRQAG